MRLRALRPLAPFLVALLVVSAVVTLAGAGPRDVDDPKDTKGRLDVRTARIRHPKGEPPEWTVLTFSTWTLAQLWDRGYLYLYLDTIGGEPADHVVMMRSDGRKMLASLWTTAKGSAGRERFVSVLNVRRRSADGVSVKVPLKKLNFGDQRAFYRWWLVTVFSSDKCPSQCFDRVPDAGSVLRYRPGMEPSPSPTASPTP